MQISTNTSIHAPSGIWIRDPSNQPAKTYALDSVSSGTEKMNIQNYNYARLL
jgi:hypothetical protein